MVVETPEEIELKAKQAEIEALSKILVEKELEHEEIKNRLAAFQSLYYLKIGSKYLELDQLHARIAELKARHYPENPTFARQAEKAQRQAQDTRREYQRAEKQPPPQPASPDQRKKIKKLYRQAAAIIHPDKALDDQSKQIRTQLMAELNDAYKNNDPERIQDILNQWKACPESISGNGIAARLIRCIRTLFNMKKRIAWIDDDIAALQRADINDLRVKVEQAAAKGKDLLAEIAAAVETKIKHARVQLTQLEKGNP